MATLFELADEYQQLFDMAIDEENPAVLADTLEAWLPVLEQKTSGYVNVIQRLDMEAKKAREIAEQFVLKAQARENSIKAMKNALMIAMDRMETKELPAGDYTIKIQKNGGKQAIQIDDEFEIPESMTKVIIEPDMDKIRKALEDGQELTWAHLQERGRHIRIK
ncbi:MAG: siphovirus Gp157 family protein [Oscillospiraceae bacterium]|nr:siphovirus Gp157 family protein [Oscillospiraceae bacterium]